MASVRRSGAARSQPPSEPYGPLYPRTIALLGGETRTPGWPGASRSRGTRAPVVITIASKRCVR